MVNINFFLDFPRKFDIVGVPIQISTNKSPNFNPSLVFHVFFSISYFYLFPNKTIYCLVLS